MDIDEMKNAASGRMQEKSRDLHKKMEGVKYKIAVYSGKGGVGKTTVAVNLAVALAKQGKKVGFLDADIDCPNANILFGINHKTVMKNGLLQPIEKHGVKVISMAFLVEDEATIMWRGPMLSKAISDFLFMTEWGDIDYFIIDLPPGTSDAPITIMQLLELTGFIAVTTPQRLATGDMLRSVNMIKKMNIPVIGIVENMCSDVFGCSKSDDYIAHIPLDYGITIASDSGNPVVIDHQHIAEIFSKIAEKIEGLNK